MKRMWLTTKAQNCNKVKCNKQLKSLKKKKKKKHQKTTYYKNTIVVQIPLVLNFLFTSKKKHVFLVQTPIFFQWKWKFVHPQYIFSENYLKHGVRFRYIQSEILLFFMTCCPTRLETAINGVSSCKCKALFVFGLSDFHLQVKQVKFYYTHISKRFHQVWEVPDI